MVRLLVFDMDGTLVETGPLKAEPYACAAHERYASILAAVSCVALTTDLTRLRVREAVEWGRSPRAEPWKSRRRCPRLRGRYSTRGAARGAGNCTGKTQNSKTRLRPHA
ncbi:MAG: HAD family hydrolase [Bacteroidota bacterium]